MLPPVLTKRFLATAPLPAYPALPLLAPPVDGVLKIPLASVLGLDSVHELVPVAHLAYAPCLPCRIDFLLASQAIDYRAFLDYLIIVEDAQILSFQIIRPAVGTSRESLSD